MDLFRLSPGTGPLVVSMPHIGTHIPDDLARRMTPRALQRPDTDWHLDILYDFLAPFNATVLMATHSRFVVDLNRPPDGASLYPGQDTTGLVPTDCGDHTPIYADTPPDDAEIEERRVHYWQPYHDQLAALVESAHARHGYALLWEAHSIKSVLPRFFPGRLPDLNLGTADGRACGTGLAERLLAAARAHDAYTSILNGRYKGGYITRQFGDPARNVHAVQLELSWRTYMDEEHPFAFRDDLAAGIRPVLRHLVQAMVDWGARSGRR